MNEYSGVYVPLYTFSESSSRSMRLATAWRTAFALAASASFCDSP